MNVLHAIQPGVGRVMGILATEGGGVNGGPGGWMPEARGILTVIIAVFVLCGSVYLILGTNVGARLAFLVVFSAFAGWMFIMGAIWWTYGIGLKGPEPTWEAVSGRTILQDTNALTQAGALDAPVVIDTDEPGAVARVVGEEFVAEGWRQLPTSAASFGQASSAAETFIIESEAFAAGEYKVMNVFDYGGERYPRLADGRVDFFAFWHKPRYSIVEIAPVLPVRVEPGRAPAVPRVDEAQPRQYVYMIRDKGAKRQPAGFITIGSLIVFMITAWLLHSRDRRVAYNRSQLALPSKA